MKTKRLILRKWEESDAEDLYKYAKDPAIGPIAGWPPHKSVEDSREIIKTALSGKEIYAVCLRESGKPVGSIGLHLTGDTDMTECEDECELGYWIGREFWGQGLIPEAARELLRRAFGILGMTTVWCGYYDGNDKSKRVQEKLGFKFHHTCNEAEVPLMNEVRVGHTSYLTYEMWKNRHISGEELSELAEKALENDELAEFLCGEKGYSVLGNRDIPDVPTDFGRIRYGGIMRLYRRTNDPKIIGKFREAIISLNDTPVRTWCGYMICSGQIISEYEKSKKKPPFKVIDKELLSAVRSNILMHKNKLRETPSWVANKKDGLWGEIVRIDNILYDDYRICVLKPEDKIWNT